LSLLRSPETFDTSPWKFLERPSGDQDLIAFGDVDLERRGFFSAGPLEDRSTSARARAGADVAAGAGVPAVLLPTKVITFGRACALPAIVSSSENHGGTKHVRPGKTPFPRWPWRCVFFRLMAGSGGDPPESRTEKSR